MSQRRPLLCALLSLGLAACGQPQDRPPGLPASLTAFDTGGQPLSERAWSADSINSWGPAERNMSNGEAAAGDGGPLRLNGRTYASGVGVHPWSVLKYALNGRCTNFTSDLGVDDEVGDAGSVAFTVEADGARLYTSGRLTGQDPARSVSVDLTGRRELRLTVTDAGDGNARDHADWAGATLTCANQPAEVSRPWVQGYYVGYAQDLYPPSAIDWSSLTHIMVGMYGPQPDGRVLPQSGIERVAPSVVAGAHAHGRRALAFIGGLETGPKWREAARDHRAAFIASLKALVQDGGYDGLDLDWEPVEAEDHDTVLAFVRDLRAALPDALLTFPADGFDNPNIGRPDRRLYAHLAPHLDRINLMTYDMQAADPDWKSWHSSPLYREDHDTPAAIDLSVQGYLDAGVPAAKLGIGVGLYGECWQRVNGPLQPANGVGPVDGDNVLSYATIMREYFNPAARRWDPVARVPYLSFDRPTGPLGCRFISYDDPQSVAEKGRYIRERGLGGLILWQLNEGAVNGGNPLLEAARDALMK